MKDKIKNYKFFYKNVKEKNQEIKKKDQIKFFITIEKKIIKLT